MDGDRWPPQTETGPQGLLHATCTKHAHPPVSLKLPSSTKAAPASCLHLSSVLVLASVTVMMMDGWMSEWILLGYCTDLVLHVFLFLATRGRGRRGLRW